jgi:uncharacterized membrane protein
MSDGSSSAVIDVTPSGEVRPPAHAVNAGHAIYACYAVGFFIGITWLVGVIIAYVKRDDGRATWMESHYSWQIRTFWWSLLWCVIGALLAITVVGLIIAWPLWIVAWLWALYRVIKGWLRLTESRSVS